MSAIRLLHKLICPDCGGDGEHTEVRAVHGLGGSGPHPDDVTWTCSACQGSGAVQCEMCEKRDAEYAEPYTAEINGKSHELQVLLCAECADVAELREGRAA